jgi:hypothetical protein
MNTETEFLDRFKTVDYLNEQFQECRDFLRSTLGLELTTIELVGLRSIVKAVAVEFYQQELRVWNDKKVDSLSLFAPHREIPSRFMLEFYGIGPQEMVRFYDEYSRQILKEYFRRKQLALHFP